MRPVSDGSGQEYIFSTNTEIKMGANDQKTEKTPPETKIATERLGKHEEVGELDNKVQKIEDCPDLLEVAQNVNGIASDVIVEDDDFIEEFLENSEMADDLIVFDESSPSDNTFDELLNPVAMSTEISASIEFAPQVQTMDSKINTSTLSGATIISTAELIVAFTSDLHGLIGHRVENMQIYRVELHEIHKADFIYQPNGGMVFVKNGYQEYNELIKNHYLKEYGVRIDDDKIFYASDEKSWKMISELIKDAYDKMNTQEARSLTRNEGKESAEIERETFSKDLKEHKDLSKSKPKEPSRAGEGNDKRKLEKELYETHVQEEAFKKQRAEKKREFEEEKTNKQIDKQEERGRLRKEEIKKEQSTK